MTTPKPEVELATLLPAPPTTGPSADERHRMDARLALLLARESAAERRGDLRRACGVRFGAPAVVTASVAAVSVLCALAVGGDPPPTRNEVARSVAAAPEAVAVLQLASTAALAVGTPVVSGDQFVYTRSTVISNEAELGAVPSVGAPHEREIWVSQDPGPTADIGVIREFGQDWPLEGAGPVPVGLVRPTYAWLDTLPTDPDELLTEIESDVGTVDADLDRDHVVFNRIGDLVREGLVPPRVAAALFKAAMLIPGVTVQTGAADALGRRGVGVSHEDRLMRSVWVFDPTTFEVLGTRDYAVLDGTDMLLGASAVLERGIADRAGTQPGSETT